jgi:DNA-binding SARP family transcriptional activator
MAGPDALALNLLRGFTFTVDRQNVPMVSSAQRLLAFLALHGRPVSRSYVAGTLWPETTSAKAAANLRSTLWRAHKVARNLLQVSARGLALSAEVAVDVHEAETQARRLLDMAQPCDDILTVTTRTLLSADILPDWYDDWLVPERERFQQLRLHALEALCERLTRLGRYGEAVDAGLVVVCAAPFRESAHRAVVRAHLAAGNRWEAVRQYERCRDLLRSELGLEPSAGLRELFSWRAAPRTQLATSA